MATVDLNITLSSNSFDANTYSSSTITLPSTTFASPMCSTMAMGNAYTWSNLASITTLNSLAIKPENSKNAIIETNKNTIDIDLLYETILAIADRLMIIVEDSKVIENNPTLKDAYDQYQVLTTLLKANKQKEND